MTERIKCCICQNPIEDERPTVFAISGYGNPRHICTECDCLLEMVARGKEYCEIKEAMDTLSGRIDSTMLDDPLTTETLNEVLESAKERADAIKEGKYDFSLDDESWDDDGFDEIPEELRETEEDRELDRKEEEANKLFDKIINWVLLAVVVLAVGFVVWWFFFRK